MKQFYHFLGHGNEVLKADLKETTGYIIVNYADMWVDDVQDLFDAGIRLTMYVYFGLTKCCA